MVLLALIPAANGARDGLTQFDWGTPGSDGQIQDLWTNDRINYWANSYKPFFAGNFWSFLNVVFIIATEFFSLSFCVLTEKRKGC